MKNENVTPTIMGLEKVEITIIELLADGLTQSEISEKLEVKESKVETIKKKLITKTRTKNTASLVSFAYKYGLLKV